jgi:hypothetical protein
VTGYRGRLFFDGQEVNRNIAKQQFTALKDVLWEYIETTQLSQHNFGRNEFWVSIKADTLTNL